MKDTLKFYPSEIPSIWDVWLDEYISQFDEYYYLAKEKKSRVYKKYKRKP